MCTVAGPVDERLRVKVPRQAGRRLPKRGGGGERGREPVIPPSDGL